MEKIRILHTNDLHSHLENWPKIRRFLNQQQAQAEDSVLTVDLGDFADRQHPLTEATNGQANVALMNQANFDVVTIGNNEGIGNAQVELNALYKQANFTVVLDNLYDKKTLAFPQWAQTSKIITTKAGTKVGFLAMTAPFPLTYWPNGWDIRQWQELLPRLVQELRPQVDVLVLLSHLGVVDDYQIANELPEIDVIIGSHTHHHFPTGQQVNGVQLAAAGRYGEYVGEVSIVVDEAHKIRQTTAQTFATEAMRTELSDAEEISDYLMQGHTLLQEQRVAWLPYDLEQDPYTEHVLIRETLQAVRKRAETEVAFLNTGLFLDELKAGEVTQDHLHSILPHPMRLIRVKMLGRDVVRMVLEIEKNRQFLRKFPIVGMGFRGKIFGEIVYDGLTYDATNREVLWHHQPIDLEREYVFATVDHLMFVPFIPSIEIAGHHEFLFPEFIRNVLADYLAIKYPLLSQ